MLYRVYNTEVGCCVYRVYNRAGAMLASCTGEGRVRYGASLAVRQPSSSGQSRPHTRQFNNCLLFALISLLPQTVIFPFQSCNHPLQSVIFSLPASNLDGGQVAIFRLPVRQTPISNLALHPSLSTRAIFCLQVCNLPKTNL